jgi:hypothetical protein
MPRVWIWVALFAAIVAAVFFARTRTTPVPNASLEDRMLLTNAVRSLMEHETGMAEKYWGPELLAEKHGAVFERLWDAINGAWNKFAVVKEFAAPKVVWAERGAVREAAHGVRILGPADRKIVFDADGFRRLLEEKEAAGWSLAQCEFRHIGFAPDKKPFRESTFYFSAHLENRRSAERVILEGDLLVSWENGAEPAVREIDASRLQVRSRTGAVPFVLAMDQEFTPDMGVSFIDPLIVRDLDRDGVPEIILAAINLVLRRSAKGEWVPSRLCEEEPRLIFTAIVADFNGDAMDDFLTASFDGLKLYEGAAGGKFPNPARLVWKAEPRLKDVEEIVCGDLDGDGDLDVFIGQYKMPAEGGNMPFPYFDADDGYPSFLLLNDAKGNFSDATKERGLGAKKRRAYSSSFIDLDGDKDLDLLVVSDFCGLEAYENDGKGFFTDATKKWFPGETQGFGMAHAFADFDGDGLMDVLMIGMNTATADRLESMGLARPYDIADAGMRRALAHGNRLFFGSAQGKFEENALSAKVARTGWSWGCAATDFDLDGYPDLFIANGHISRRSVRDYDSEFWLHDIYVGKSRENPIAAAYFNEKVRRSRPEGMSYGGYEKNRFFLNEGGTNFVEVGFLFGVALEADSKNVVARDLNGDGKPELIVTTSETYPKVRQTLKIYGNRLDSKFSGRRAAEFKVTGESYRSQSN